MIFSALLANGGGKQKTKRALSISIVAVFMGGKLVGSWLDKNKLAHQVRGTLPCNHEKTQ